MAMAMSIELIQTEPGLFTVIAGDRFADHLARDEALGVVAALLFGGAHCPPYLKSYAEWHRWQQRYSLDKPAAPVALLSWRGASAH